MRTLFKIFKSGLLVLALVVAMDRSFGAVIEHFLLSEQQGDSFETRRALMDTKEDIVIVGSSRAQHHYIPVHIERSTGMSCYNYGRDGMKLFYYETLLNSIISYHTPKIVILDLTFGDLEYDENERALVTAAVIPYMNKNKVLANQLYQDAPLEYWKARLSILYRLNSLPVSILQHHLRLGNKSYQGYEPLYGCHIDSAIKRIEANNDYKESDLKFQALKRIIQMTRDKNIKLIVIVSPALQVPTRNAIITATKLLSESKIMLYDYSQIYSVEHRLFFHDPGHLNNLGAMVFTNRIIKEQLIENHSDFQKSKSP